MRIEPKNLVPMDLFTDDFPVRIVLDYARPDNLLFGEKIYRDDARLWLHEKLAAIVLLAARLCHEKHGLFFVLHDGLRTTDAQEKMLRTKRVADNPQWLEAPRLLSPPGAGGHPRGMAVDISLQTETDDFLNMGTEFDFLAQNPGPASNPAHREYLHSPSVRENRQKLDKPMLEAALRLNSPLQLLPQEWWDFRFKSNFYEEYQPLSDSNLPAQMRMTENPVNESPVPDFDDEHFEMIRDKITATIETNL